MGSTPNNKKGMHFYGIVSIKQNPLSYIKYLLVFAITSRQQASYCVQEKILQR